MNNIIDDFSVKLDDVYENSEYGTITFYFTAAQDILKEFFAHEEFLEASGAEISIECPIQTTESFLASVEMSPTRFADGAYEDYDWRDVDLPCEEIDRLLTLAQKTRKDMALKQKILTVAKYVRFELNEQKPNNHELCGCCVQASDRIQELLRGIGIESKVVEGWIIYDDDSCCSDRCYDEHTWLECEGFYVDVTASQFNSAMIDKLQDVIVSFEKPSCMVYEEPEYQWLDEREGFEGR